MSTSPRYSKTEIERRWLVAAPLRIGETPNRERYIEDRYILGTRLRLRVVTEANRLPTYKLGKKYESEVGGTHQAVTTYLNEDEYKILALPPARVGRKRRFSVLGGSLDVYEYPEHRFEVFEIEFPSSKDAEAYVPPAFAGREVTSESEYSGFALASSQA